MSVNKRSNASFDHVISGWHLKQLPQRLQHWQEIEWDQEEDLLYRELPLEWLLIEFVVKLNGCHVMVVVDFD